MFAVLIRQRETRRWLVGLFPLAIWLSLGLGQADQGANARDDEESAPRGKPASPEDTDDPIDACQAALDQGIGHEQGGRYLEARVLYRRAVALCPREPVPRRFLAELYRFHTGEWALAEAQFLIIMELTAAGEDEFSRAVALQGLGKLELWKENAKEGLRLLQASMKLAPNPLCARHLADYWHAAGDLDKAFAYSKIALDLDPDEPYNRIFYAAFLAARGELEEARVLARETPFHPSQLYNRGCLALACGQRDAGFTLLKRHFEEFETNDRVRLLEMTVARQDMFMKPYWQDPDFLALTKMALPGTAEVLSRDTSESSDGR